MVKSLNSKYEQKCDEEMCSFDAGCIAICVKIGCKVMRMAL